jgi:acyl-CoA thioesterase-1
MKPFALLSVVFVICLAQAGCRSQESPNAPVAPASPQPSSAAPAGPSSSAPADAPKNSVAKIVAFGDSLTAGQGLAPADSYTTLLQERLDRDNYKYEVVNAGVSGNTSTDGLQRIDWSVDGNVKIVILELGANDILRMQPISEMKKNLGQIIDMVKSKGAQVLLAGMEAPTNDDPQYRQEAHQAFVDLAREKQVRLIPFLLDHVGGVASLNQSDGIHPNAAGEKIMTQTVYDSLKPMLQK